jgi:hypothetical protein
MTIAFTGGDHMSVSRRSILKAGVYGGVAAAVGTLSLDALVQPAAAATPALAIGTTSKGTQTVEQLDTLTGRFAQIVRAYHHQGTAIPQTLSAAGLLPYLQTEGRQVVYSLKIPDSSTATYNACNALAADIVAKGYTSKIRIILWHEPYPELTASAFIARYTAIAPAIRSHGVPCGVCFHTYPIWHKGLDYTTYWPGNSITDFMGIDTYPGDDAASQGVLADPLATIAPLTSFAKAQGKPFGIAEFGVNSTDAAANPSGSLAWIERFESLGSHCQFVIYYDDEGIGLELNNGLLVPAYQQLYDHFGG